MCEVSRGETLMTYQERPQKRISAMGTFMAQTHSAVGLAIRAQHLVKNMLLALADDFETLGRPVFPEFVALGNQLLSQSVRQMKTSGTFFCSTEFQPSDYKQCSHDGIIQ